MTKLKILFASFMVLIAMFIAVLFINVNGMNFKNLWFSFVLLFIGIYVLIYFALFGLDSSLYYSLLLILLSLATGYRFASGIDFEKYYPIYMLCFAFASLAVFVWFRQYIHFKIFAILSTWAILLISCKISLLPFEAVMFVNIMFFIYALLSVVIRVRKNLRRE